MPFTQNLYVDGYTNMVQAIQALQAYLGRPVSTTIDPQGLGLEIIKLETYLSTQVAGGQPSGFKFDPAKVKKAVADHSLRGAIMTLEKSVDLT